jgi:perosamine synthetase
MSKLNEENDMISIYNPEIKKYKKSALVAIESVWISNHGKFVEFANNKLKDITQSKYSILMANGTCSTHCLFLSLKFKYPNINKIYIPNNCYVAAWNAALMEFNINKLEVMSMNINTWNISTDEDYIKSLEENSAILIVHNLGNIVNVPKLKKIRPDLIFVEDNCEGMFGKYEEIYSGMSESSLCSSCSFYGNKIITTGEGGAFFTQDEEVYNYIKSVYSQGMSDIRYLHNLHAYNYRMTNIQAAFLYDQLNDIDNILENKYKIFNNYDKLLKKLVELGKVQLINKEDNNVKAPWIYALRIINNKKTIEETRNFFVDHNIDIRPFFYPINSHEHLKNIKNNDEISYILNKEIILFPSSPSITHEQQKKVIDTIYKFIDMN